MCKTKLVTFLIAVLKQTEFRTYTHSTCMNDLITIIKKKKVAVQSMLPEVSGALRFRVLCFRAVLKKISRSIEK